MGYSFAGRPGGVSQPARAEGSHGTSNLDAYTLAQEPRYALTVGVALGLGLSTPVLAATQADLVVVGDIATMAEEKPRAGGMAVADGRIVFVGDAKRARKLLRPGGRLIELRAGQIALPGLIDSHVHMLDAGVMRQRCLLDDATTKAQALGIIQTRRPTPSASRTAPSVR